MKYGVGKHVNIQFTSSGKTKLPFNRQAYGEIIKKKKFEGVWQYRVRFPCKHTPSGYTSGWYTALQFEGLKR